jgi:hypothetical protein
VLAVAALLLAGGGLMKLVRPTATALALGVPAAAVRTGAAAETVLGVTAIVQGGSLAAALVAASYAGFTVFVTTALFRGRPLSTCGCFGEPDTPPTALHVVVDLALAAGAGAGAARGGATVTFPQLVAAAVVAYLCFLALGALPRALVATRP